MEAVAWALFIPACFALNMAPGPNNLLAFTNAARFGFIHALVGGSGRLVAFALMVTLVAVGLGALLATSETAFLMVKWCGAAYLIYVGIKLVRSRPATAAAQEHVIANRTQLMRQEFLFAAGNPKAIAIFTAFFPQFIEPSTAAFPQLLAMGGVFLALELVAIGIYSFGGTVARSLLNSVSVLTWLNKGVGAFLVGSGVSLALSSR